MGDSHSVSRKRGEEYTGSGVLSLLTIRAAAVMLLLAACRVSPATPREPVNTPDLPVVADEVADSLLVDLKSVDSTIVVDLRYATRNNFTGAVLPGYEANRAYLRGEAAAALALVQEDLRSQALGLRILDAYRPARATDAMVAWTYRSNRTDLLRDGYIASRSRHNLGVAVDLTLVVLATGAEVDMGTPFDTFSSAAHTANARGQIARNRQILKRTMERQGFVNYEKEWWHFSYPVPNPVRFDKVIR
jgi:D-alanyl-D-alanine dipeptidase